MPPPRAPRWRTMQVVEVVAETSTARTLVLEPAPGGDSWPGHRPGQHVDVRLTAPDGYQASRSYSLATAGDEAPAITVQSVPDGEVSTFLVEVAEVGDELEILGPIGGYFVWEPDVAPVLLFGGGSGIVPLRSMWRSRPAGAAVAVRYSARTADRVLFADELAAPDLDAQITLTRERHPDFAHGRLDAESVTAAVERVGPTSVFVCGPNAFVDAVAAAAVSAGVPAADVRTERFG